MNTLNSSWVGWLLWLLGFDVARMPADATSVEFTFLNLPSSWGVFVLIGLVAALAAAVFLLYAREIETCPRRVKLTLAGVRLAVLLCLVLVLLSPSLTYKQTKVREAYVVVLRDASQSMNTADSYPDDAAAEAVAKATGQPVEQVRSSKPTRVQLVNQLLAKENGRFVRLLEQRGKVRLLDFADQVEKVGTWPARLNGPDGSSAAERSGKGGQTAGEVPGTTIPPLEAQGRGTNLSLAIKEAMAVSPLAAVVILTDGQHTAGDDPVPLAQQAKQKGAGLYIVGVGDPSRIKNLAVRNVYVRPQVWPDEPFEIDAVIAAEGVLQPAVRVELVEHRLEGPAGALGPGRVVAQKTLTLPHGGGRARVSFDRSVRQPGRYGYTVTVEAVPGERNVEDNRRTSSEVDAVKEKSKVLLIAGAPTWEYRLVQRLLQRDQTISLSCWLQTMDLERPQEGDEPIAQLPTTMKQLAKYHVVMLFDPNPNEFDAAWIELLKDFAAKRSGGVLYLAGPKYTSRFLGGARTGGLKDLLPVRFGDVQRTEAESLLASNRRSWPLRIAMENLDHPIMSFHQDPQKNLARWETLPGIYWSFPAVEAKPTAKVLLEHSDPVLRRMEGSRPLLVAGRYGAANTVYIGFNGTWRWRRVGRQAEFFDKFWLQVIRFLIETRTLQGQRRGYVQPDRDLYEVGDRILLTAHLQDATYEPLELSQVEATLRNGEGQPRVVILKRQPGPAGHYAAAITARQAGHYTLEIELAGSEGGGSTRLNTSFRVQMPRVETKHVWLNEKLLRQIAQASGGQYYRVNQLDQLAADLPDANQIIEVPGKPVLLWSAHRVPYRLFALLLTLLTAEWAFRKGFKLL